MKARRLAGATTCASHRARSGPSSRSFASSSRLSPSCAWAGGKQHTTAESGVLLNGEQASPYVLLRRLLGSAGISSSTQGRSNRSQEPND